jgi:GTP-binding protein HflX
MVDLANPLYEEQIQIIENVLGEIGAGEIPTILVPNKVDLAGSVPVAKLKTNGVAQVCPISALTGTGVDELLAGVGRILDQSKERIEVRLSPTQSWLTALLRERGRVVEEHYEGESIKIVASVTPKLAGQIRKALRLSCTTANGSAS